MRNPSFSPQALTGKRRFAIGLHLLLIASDQCSKIRQECGQVAEWLKAADCKSARVSVHWFESSPVHHFTSTI